MEKTERDHNPRGSKGHRVQSGKGRVPRRKAHSSHTGSIKGRVAKIRLRKTSPSETDLIVDLVPSEMMMPHAKVTRIKLRGLSSSSPEVVARIKEALFGLSPTKTRVSKETDEIISRVEAWAGSRAKAEKWFRSQVLDSLGGQTAEGLVQTGQAAAVRRYLSRIAVGGFA